MKTIKIAGHNFNILSLIEAKELTKDCNHKWQKATKEVIVNPGMEFVEGYGNQLVSVQIAQGKRCSKCGLLEIETELDKAIKSGKLKRILTQRSKQKTICEMLRELHDELPQYRNKIDTCLLVAKKMNDKLVEYAGTTHAKDWYDKDGNFIDDK